MDYATMPAGPELDRLVAERVMGWRAVLISAGERHVDGDVDFRPLVGGLYVYDRPTHIRGPWSPSTDIAAAWEVGASHFGWRAVLWQTGAGWACVLMPRNAGWTLDQAARDRLRADADTAPLAICRAALAAMLR